jgi:hypothetical protein
MIGERQTPAKPWSPEGFERFVEHYPATEWRAPPAPLDRTDDFINAWQANGGNSIESQIGIVLTPGLFAEWLPTCFRAARRAFGANGHRVLQTRARTGFGIRAQAEALNEAVLRWLRADERFIWCAHSKGGLDALYALHNSATLQARCAAVVIVQPPVGRSWLVDKWLHSPVTLREKAMGFALRRRQFRDGVRDISTSRDAQISDWIVQIALRVPVLHAVSWSTRATSWVDSYHKQLNALRPGHAHDGQFFLADQCLPSMPMVCLPALDHAQPVLGGLGFDAARLWRALAFCAWQRAGSAKSH